MPTFRADQVGSLLRPPHLLKAHASAAEGRIDADELRRIEDEAILVALEMQRESGIDVLSDGEYRRSTWAGDFTAAVEGYVPGEPPVTLRWRGQAGAPAEAPSTTGGRVIGERLRQMRRLTGHEASFLAQHAGDKPFKVTMPAPSYIVARGFKPGITDRTYGSRAELMADVSRIIGDEVRAIVSEGVRYIQLDNPHYPDYLDAGRREEWRAQGVDPDQALREDIEGDNAVLQGIDRSGLTLAMHICRGNGGQAGWHTEGSYEPIAEQVFGRIDVDRFLLEYDSERAGGFEPLRFMPAGKMVVLGLVTTKAGVLEASDLLLRRIEEASRYVPVENLALSPQCGFASVMAGNPLTWDEQKRKLELVVETARRVWNEP